MEKTIVKEKSKFKEFIDGLKQALFASDEPENEELPKELKAAIEKADKIMGEETDTKSKKNKVVPAVETPKARETAKRQKKEKSKGMEIGE